MLRFAKAGRRTSLPCFAVATLYIAIPWLPCAKLCPDCALLSHRKAALCSAVAVH